MQNKILILLLILLIAGVIPAFNFLQNKNQKLNYVTTNAEIGEIISSIKATGNLQPTKKAEIFPHINGLVKNVLVNVNDNISIGQTLAEIDSSEYRARYNQANARLRKAREDLENFKESHAVNENLYERRLISKTEYDESLSRYRSAIVTIEDARAEFQRAKINLGNTKIKSTVNGIVLENNIIAGQQILETKSIPAFVLAENLTKLSLICNVSESDIGKIQIGQYVEFRVDAFPEKLLKGEIVQISNLPTTENNLVTYNVTSFVNNDELNLKPGMTAEVEIIISSKENILIVPTAALRFSPEKKSGNNLDSKKTTVWILNENQPVPVVVETGISDDYYTEIISGNISVGDQVVVESYINGNSDKGPSLALPQPKRF